MVTTRQEWLEQTRSCLCKMAEVVAERAASPPPSASWGIPDPVMHALQQGYHRIRASLGAFPPTPATGACQQQQQQQLALFFTDFTALLDTLVPQLCKLDCGTGSTGASRNGHVQHGHAFWQVWGLLLSGCSACQDVTVMFCQTWMVDLQPSYRSLYASYHSLLTWLLPMTRGAAWQSLQPASHLDAKRSELVGLLSLPVKLLLAAASTPPPTGPIHLAMIPSAFAPLLCCITAEQLCNVPPIVAQPPFAAVAAPQPNHSRILSVYGFNSCSAGRYQVLQVLTEAVERLIHCAGTVADRGAHKAMITSPAVVQLLKAILTLPKRSLTTVPDLFLRGLSSLHCLLHARLTESEARPGTPLSMSDRTANHNAAGLPLHLNPFLSQPVLQADELLIHTLIAYLDGDVGLTERRYNVLAALMRTWVQAGKLYPSPLEARRVMADSVVGVAQHATSVGLQLLLRQRQAGAAVKPPSACASVEKGRHTQPGQLPVLNAVGMERRQRRMQRRQQRRQQQWQQARQQENQRKQGRRPHSSGD
ncbi:MAG: hypothetical protein WDW38_008304 [Sanguina aurantia]